MTELGARASRRHCRKFGQRLCRGCPARTAKRSCCGTCVIESRRRSCEQLLATARLRTCPRHWAEPVFLGRPVRVVLRGLQFHRRACWRGRGDVSRANRAVCVSSVLCVAERDARLFVRHHSLLRLVQFARHRLHADAADSARNALCSTSFRKPCSSAVGDSFCWPARS